VLPTPTPGQAAAVVACDPERDRAVVFVDNPPNRRVFLVRLSDGAITEGPAACSQAGGMSADGRSLVQGDAPMEPGRSCNLDSGEVTDLPVSGWLLGDGRTVASYEEDECGWYRRLVVTDAQTGERFWTSDAIDDQLPCNQGLLIWRTHPSTASFAVQVTTINDTSSPPTPGAVYISDGPHPPVLVAPSADYAVVF
jgi:hypothetical protein